MAGARERAQDDEQLLDQMAVVLDAFYAHFTSTGTTGTGAAS
jgi:hypothetical protein